MSGNYKEYDAEKLEFLAVADEGELGNGERLFLEIDEHHIILFNIAGAYYAIADLCSHDNGPLEAGALENEHHVACPRHGARFDVRDGKALSLPAVVDIPAYPVRVVDGQIEIGIPL